MSGRPIREDCSTDRPGKRRILRTWRNETIELPAMLTGRLSAEETPASATVPVDRVRWLWPALFSAACLALLLWVSWEQWPIVLGTLQTIDARIAGLSLLTYLSGIFLNALRAQLICLSLGLRLSAVRVFLYSLVGLFFGNFLPTTMGGDVVRASYLSHRAERVVDAFTVTALDRGIGLAGVLLLGGWGVLALPGLAHSSAIALLPPIVLGGLLALMIFSRIDRGISLVLGIANRSPIPGKVHLIDLITGVVSFLRSPIIVLLSLVLTFASLATGALSLWIVAKALGHAPEFAVFVFLVPVVVLASMLPSINGIGVREAVFFIVLRGHVPPEAALTLALVFFGLSVASSLLGGIVFLFRKPLGLAVDQRLLRIVRRVPRVS